MTKSDQYQLRIEPIRTRTKYDQDQLGPTRTDYDLLEPITPKTKQDQDQIRPGPIRIRIKDDQDQLGLGPTTIKTKGPTKTRTNYDQRGPTRTYQDQLRLGQTKATRRAVQRRRANGATRKRCNNRARVHDAKNSRNSRQSELLYIKFTMKEQTLLPALVLRGKSTQPHQGVIGIAYTLLFDFEFHQDFIMILYGNCDFLGLPRPS